MSFSVSTIKTRWTLAFAAAFLLLAPAALMPSPDEAAGKPPIVTVIFTGDVNGYLEPCG